MTYWIITLLDTPVPKKGVWYYSGVPASSRIIEYGDSPVRDHKSRCEKIAELATAGANFTVEKLGT